MTLDNAIECLRKNNIGAFTSDELLGNHGNFIKLSMDNELIDKNDNPVDIDELYDLDEYFPYDEYSFFDYRNIHDEY